MVSENLRCIQDRINSACLSANRNASGITIVAVTKNRSLEEINEVILAGIADLGENRVQEGVFKYNNLQLKAYSLKLKWHMVGHLQTNKVKEAVKIFDLIHSVDSLRLAQEINKEAAKINKIQDILIEVKTSPEATKSGIAPEEAVSLIKELGGFKNISVKGLMTIAPLVDNPEEARPYFKKLRELRDTIYELRFTNYDLRILSMGMTDDFEIALEEGANIIRLGRAIFE